MSLIEIQNETPSAAKLRAENLILEVNQGIEARVSAHKQAFTNFWYAEDVTPDEILAEMGENAVLWVQVASESANHIDRLAKIVGKSLDDFLTPEWYVPVRPFVFGEDGSITLGPAPEPEPDPDEEIEAPTPDE